MAAAVAVAPLGDDLTTRLHDPFSPHHTAHFSPAETSALLDLLAVDNLVDSRAAATSPDIAILNDLLAVDHEFARADKRDHSAIATAPERKDEKDLLLDLLATDQAVDGARGRTTASSTSHQHYATTGAALHDPYARREANAIAGFASLYAPAPASADVAEGEKRLRDNVVMMHLLAVDEVFDDTKRYQRLIASDDYAVIGELHEVDREVSGAKRRALLVEDLQGLLDVDHLVDGVKKGGAPPAADAGGGKRSIFSMKEKYTAKVASGKF